MAFRCKIQTAEMIPVGSLAYFARNSRGEKCYRIEYNGKEVQYSDGSRLEIAPGFVEFNKNWVKLKD